MQAARHAGFRVTGKRRLRWVLADHPVPQALPARRSGCRSSAVLKTEALQSGSGKVTMGRIIEQPVEAMHSS
jgi:hypothetical protein